jgi:hypothetical protein
MCEYIYVCVCVCVSMHDISFSTPSVVYVWLLQVMTKRRERIARLRDITHRMKYRYAGEQCVCLCISTLSSSNIHSTPSHTHTHTPQACPHAHGRGISACGHARLHHTHCPIRTVETKHHCVQQVRGCSVCMYVPILIQSISPTRSLSLSHTHTYLAPRADTPPAHSCILQLE